VRESHVVPDRRRRRHPGQRGCHTITVAVFRNGASSSPSCHQIQQIVHDRVRMAPIYEYIWPSGIGPRVAEPALLLINPSPWWVPLEDVRLTKRDV